jgi:hypothetical protein
MGVDPVGHGQHDDEHQRHDGDDLCRRSRGTVADSARWPHETGDFALSGVATLTTLLKWKALEAQYKTVKALTLRALFTDDPGRG